MAVQLSKPLSLLLTVLPVLGTTLLISPTAKAVDNTGNRCGSGSTWVMTPNELLADFESACNNHNKCYSDLSQSRFDCDHTLLTEMLNKCNAMYSDWWEVLNQRECYGQSKFYYDAVRELAGNTYDRAQELALAGSGTNL